MTAKICYYVMISTYEGTCGTTGVMPFEGCLDV